MVGRRRRQRGAAALPLLLLAGCLLQLPGTPQAYHYVRPDAIERAYSVAGHTTYHLIVELIGGAETLYSLIGSTSGAMEMPPAYQVKAPFGSNVGGVNPQFVSFKKEVLADSWLTVGITDGDGDSALSTAGLSGWSGWSATKGFKDSDAAVFWMKPTASTARATRNGRPVLIVTAQLTVKTGWKGKAAMGLVGFLKNGNEWRENHVVWNIGCGNPDIPSWLSGAPPPPPPPPPKQDSEWPASYILSGTFTNTRDYQNAVGAFVKTNSKCDGVPVYMRRGALKDNEHESYVLYLYRRPRGARGAAYWTIGETQDSTKHQTNGAVNCGASVVSFDTSGADGCSVSPDSPGCECQWRECKGYDCFAFPRKDGDWLPAAASIHITAGGGSSSSGGTTGCGDKCSSNKCLYQGKCIGNVDRNACDSHKGTWCGTGGSGGH